MERKTAPINTPGGNSQLSKITRLLIKHDFWSNVRYDLFNSHILKPDGRWLEDIDYDRIRMWLAARMNGATPRIDAVVTALNNIAHERRFDALTEHVHALPEWDGHPRLDTWLTAWLGAPDEPVIRWMGRKFLISMIARALYPGCKVDTTLTLIGPQGHGKSEAMRILGEPFHKELSSGDLTDKDSRIQLQGAWLVEFPDLGSISRAEINTIKGFLTQREDNFRPPYARVSKAFPRRCVFCITTNKIDFINDPSGARRIFPITVFLTRNAFVQMRSERNQLLSEAREMCTNGERWWAEISDDSSEITSLEAVQTTVQQADCWDDVVAEWIGAKEEVTIRGIFQNALGKPTADISRADQMRMADCLNRLGFHVKLVKTQGRMMRVYRRG